MRQRVCTILAITLMGATALAATPDLLDPVSLLPDSGTIITATGMDFMDHSQSGTVNFNPNNYDIYLPGKIMLSTQDVVAYSGAGQPLKDCEDFAKNTADALIGFIDFFVNKLAPKISVPVDPIDPAEFQKVSSVFMGVCKDNKTPDQQAAFVAGKFMTHQVLADIRNSAKGSTDIIFSGESVDPYTAGFPLGTASTGVVVSLSPDAGTDAVVLGSPHSFNAGASGISKSFGTNLLSESLILYRFVGPKKVLQFNSISFGWLDRPLKTAAGNIANPACFEPSLADPKFPIVPKSDAELLKAGCVGEGDVVAIATPHLYTNTNAALESQDKSKDLVVLSRSPMGSKIGYLTIYRRTDKVPDDKSIFQDLWQFEKSVTHSQYGIPEPYGITVVKNWDVKTNKFTEAVVAGSNKLQGDNYYVYYFANGGQAEPKAIMVGGDKDKSLPGFGGFGPYGLYSTDVNGDGCGDILITRAKIAPDGKAITFADYFDVHLQKTGPAGCLGDFDSKGDIYKVQPIAAQLSPQISSLAIADFDKPKDGLNDIMAGDFTSYPNAATKINENVVHYLQHLNGGLFNTVQPPHFVVTTKAHDADVGVIDLNVDTHANLGVVTGNAMKFPPIIVKPKSACAEGLIDIPFNTLCTCNRDLDLDGIGDIFVDLKTFPNGLGVIKVAMDCKKDVGGNFIYSDLDLKSNVKVTYTDCQGVSTTDTPRKLLIDWTQCDNCNTLSTDQCTGPEKNATCVSPQGQNVPCGDQCANPSQTDSDLDGYGDECDAHLNDASQSSLAPKMMPVAKIKKQLREDKVMYTDAQPVIANYTDLKVVDAKLPADKGHEVTVLLNKTTANGTPQACQGTDVACFCEKNPNQTICKCMKDPSAPECKTKLPLQGVTCCLDVGREGLTAPFGEGQLATLRAKNDQFRKDTGLCWDPYIPFEGAQYHFSCVLTGAPAAGDYAPVFLAAGSPIPVNYFRHTGKPVGSRNLLKNNLLLNPVPDKSTTGGVPLDLSSLPTPDFSYDASLSSIAPDATVNTSYNVTQLDGVMQVMTFAALVDPNTGALSTSAPLSKQAMGGGGAVDPVLKKAVFLDGKGFSFPPPCQWKGDDCPDPQNALSADVLGVFIQNQSNADLAAGKPVDLETINAAVDEALKVTGASSFGTMKFVVNSAQGAIILPVTFVSAGTSFGGGACGCTFSTPSNMYNTVLPLLMALSALGGMFILRRNTAKKH